MMHFSLAWAATFLTQSTPTYADKSKWLPKILLIVICQTWYWNMTAELAIYDTVQVEGCTIFFQIGLFDLMVSR